MLQDAIIVLLQQYKKYALLLPTVLAFNTSQTQSTSAGSDSTLSPSLVQILIFIEVRVRLHS